ncbi:MAG: hypothetical protein M3220_12145 [Chloroflexota bacterium]|nr:hypothetical protein [Chloroflexota bacterium]
MKRFVLLSFLILLLVGCNGLGQPSAEEIVRRAEAAIENLEQAHAVVEVEATVEDEIMRVLGEGWMLGEQKRAVVLEASEPELVGTLAVSDGEVGWLYHPGMNMALTGTIEELKAYQEEQADVPQEMDLAELTEMVDELLQVTEQELIGEDTIAGLDTWHLRLTPNEEAPRAWIAVGGIVDLWISKEYDVPLQLIYSGGSFGEGRVTVQQYDAEAPIGQELFDFAPPADAEIVDVASLLPEQMTLPEAQEAAPFPLLSTPLDSADAVLVSVYRVGDSYVQEFEGTLGKWTLVQGASMSDLVMKHREHHEAGAEMSTEAVTVRGHEGELRTEPVKGRTFLSWREGDNFVLLSGQLSPEVALRLAEELR